LRHDRLDAPWVIGGAMSRELFDLYGQTQLAPTLHKGDVVIPDNLSTHRSPKAAAILKDIGAWFVLRGKPSTGRLSDPPNACRLAPPTLASLKSVHRTDFLTLLTHRDGIRQDQDRRRENDPPDRFLNLLTQKGRCPNIRPTLASRRKRLQPLQGGRMLQLLQGCGL